MTGFCFPILPPHFDQLGTCATLVSSSDALLKWVKENEFVDSVVSYPGDDNQPLWAEVALHLCTDEANAIHLHIDIFRSKPTKAHAADEQVVANAISKFIEVAQAETVDEAFCQARARFSVPRQDIPEYGMIAKLLNFSKVSCEKRFKLASGTLEIEDDLFDTLRFNYDERKDVVRFELWASGAFDLNSEYFDQFARLMKIGVECFVLEGIEKELPRAKD